MKDNVFLDTNVFVYLYSEDEPDKRNKVLDILKQHNCNTSTQVLNELCHVCLKKLNKSAEEINLAVEEIYNECNLSLVDIIIIKKALSLHKKLGYSYYDCLIIASALACNCKYLFTEDLSNGQMIENKLNIMNIFAI